MENKLVRIPWLVNVVVAFHVSAVMYWQAVNDLAAPKFASQAVARADLGGGGMAPNMPNIVQHDTETTQSWCVLQ